MNIKIKKTLYTAGKYLLWTTIGAACTFGLEQIVPNISDKFIYIAPIIAALLKSLATYAATEKEEIC